ncbi:MAG: tRNA (N(6)-L-threonylcarbamoyladenosine(37)-C(2))-methylthiotransferase MtaB, partial [Bacteroidia bacterium]|nr:tRNA (N(6)-L-threonylcarbamoyladenosine(37)-C(2))-methylthiotransferase MtaB [Bacteroidia bacterium]
MKVSFYTLGCKLNFSETATIARQFESRGLEKCAFEDGADVYVINTCSVTETADKDCRKVVRQALRFNPNAFVIVTGCYAQLKPETIAQIPGVSAVLGANEKFRLFDYLTDFQKQSQTMVCVNPIQDAQTFHASWATEERTRAFLKIQDGCDYHCSFCTIPLARGESRSASPEQVIKQAQQIAMSGSKEIILTGVNTGDYGNGLSINFLDLLRQLDQEVDIPRIRISSIEPNLLSDEIIEFVASSKRIMPHFHIPLQSGSNAILAKMRRRYKRELYASRVKRIVEAMPHACIGSDVIVGFPGETEAHFLETYHFLTEQPIAYLHVFTYSERPNTVAQTMSGTIPIPERTKRNHQLRTLSEKKR